MRRSNLDAFWSRKPGTVEATRSDSRKFTKVTLELVLHSVLPMMGSFPAGDPQGVGVYVCVIRILLDKGRNHPTLKFEPVRKIRVVLLV